MATIGCALTTSNGYLALALITGGFVFLAVSEIFSTSAGVGPTLMLLLFCSSRNLALRAGARSVAARVFVAAFSFFDIQSVLVSSGVDLTERESKLPEGVIISVSCWVALFARWLAVLVFALNAQGTSPYRLISSKDPTADIPRAITTAFSYSLNPSRASNFLERRHFFSCSNSRVRC